MTASVTTREYQPIPLPHRVARNDAEMLARATDFYALMQQRHTCRFFDDRPVGREIIDQCLLAAGTAPSGANRQPWHFALVQSPGARKRIRSEAEAEERAFYAGKAGKDWLETLAPLGTDSDKPFLETAAWLIVVFAQRYLVGDDGSRHKNYYVPESVGIATGMLITALHNAGLSCLTHTPAPMGFLNEICRRPDHEKPEMILVVGHPAADATIPAAALDKKTLAEISSTV